MEERVGDPVRVESALMVNPTSPVVRPEVSAAAARVDVTSIFEQFGWDSDDEGFVESALPIEALCLLARAPGMLRHQWIHAFSRLKI